MLYGLSVKKRSYFLKFEKDWITDGFESKRPHCNLYGLWANLAGQMRGGREIKTETIIYGGGGWGRELEHSNRSH